MTDYNNGEWHGWNGGECPVHPQSVIEGYWRCDDKPCAGSATYNISRAGGLNFAWDGNTRLQIFRVVTPYVEPAKPREWWVYIGSAYDSEVAAADFRARLDEKHPGKGYDTMEIIHVAEVIK